MSHIIKRVTKIKKRGDRNAKSFKEMKDATSKGVAGATMAKTKRENYKAAHRVKVPVFGGISG